VERSGAPRGGEVDGSAVVTAFDANHFAHFVEAGAESDPDAIGEGLLAGDFRVVEVVGGKEGHAAVIVAGVDDLGHGVLNPVGRLGSAKFIENENIGLVNRLENAKFRRLGDRVVTVLDLLEQVAKIIKETTNSLLKEGIEGSDGKVSLADATRAHQEETDVEDGVLPNQLLRVRHGVRLGAKDLVSGEIVALGMKVLEGAALIATRKTGVDNQLGPPFGIATAADADPLSDDQLPPGSLTQWTVHIGFRLDLRLDLGDLSVVPVRQALTTGKGSPEHTDRDRPDRQANTKTGQGASQKT
jgi:hypothetical protein